LDDWATPEVDAFSALKLDQQFKVKKFVQERDKEMFNVQCAFLIATGPLCGLRDCIKNDSAPPYEEIKVAFEQALCLLGPANAQLSILRRQRVLAAINCSRTNLAQLALPNAKSWLFGDDFSHEVSHNRISPDRQHDHHRLHQQQRGYMFPQLMTLALEMWDWCQERDILVIASHIPGRDVSADKESR